MSMTAWQGIRLAIAGWRICVKVKEWNGRRKAKKAAEVVHGE